MNTYPQYHRRDILSSRYFILHHAVREFSKLERFSIGVSILHILLDCIKHCFLATTLPAGAQKLHAVAIASAHFDSLKLFVRLSLDMHALEESAYLNLIPHFGLIGNMLGGWLKQTGNPKPNLESYPKSQS